MKAGLHLGVLHILLLSFACASSQNQDLIAPQVESVNGSEGDAATLFLTKELLASHGEMLVDCFKEEPEGTHNWVIAAELDKDGHVNNVATQNSCLSAKLSSMVFSEEQTSFPRPVFFRVLYSEPNSTVKLSEVTTPITKYNGIKVGFVVEEHYRDIKACYDPVHAEVPDLYGTLIESFIIMPTGAVSGSKTVQHLSDERVGVCISQATASWKFPPPSDGDWLVVDYPFEFRPDFSVEGMTESERIQKALNKNVKSLEGCFDDAESKSVKTYIHFNIDGTVKLAITDGKCLREAIKQWSFQPYEMPTMVKAQLNYDEQSKLVFFDSISKGRHSAKVKSFKPNRKTE